MRSIETGKGEHNALLMLKRHVFHVQAELETDPGCVLQVDAKVIAEDVVTAIMKAEIAGRLTNKIDIYREVIRFTPTLISRETQTVWDYPPPVRRKQKQRVASIG